MFGEFCLMLNSEHFFVADPDSDQPWSNLRWTTPIVRRPEGWHSLLQVRDPIAAGKLAVCYWSHGPVEIVDLRIKHGDLFIVMLVCQREGFHDHVWLPKDPEGTRVSGLQRVIITPVLSDPLTFKAHVFPFRGYCICSEVNTWIPWTVSLKKTIEKCINIDSISIFNAGCY